MIFSRKKIVLHPPPHFFSSVAALSYSSNTKAWSEQVEQNHTSPFSNLKFWLTSWHRRIKKKAVIQIATLSHRQKQPKKKSWISNIKLRFWIFLSSAPAQSFEPRPNFGVWSEKHLRKLQIWRHGVPAPNVGGRGEDNRYRDKRGNWVQLLKVWDSDFRS